MVLRRPVPCAFVECPHPARWCGWIDPKWGEMLLCDDHSRARHGVQAVRYRWVEETGRWHYGWDGGPLPDPWDPPGS